jgi:hypothetical protein
MITYYPHDSLGKADHGWLKTSHHFSFAHYYNPARMGFGALRVINDDWIGAKSGFPPHPHRDMEIITYVRTGEITHQDSEGNKGTTKSGEVQVMSAGTGVVHSEYNVSDEPLTLFQIWILPNQLNVKPRWEAKSFPTQASENELPLLVSGFKEDEEKALFIHQHARIYGGRLDQGTSIDHPIQQQAYVVVSNGSIDLKQGNQVVSLNKGDAAEITHADLVNIHAETNAEVLVLDVPS